MVLKALFQELLPIFVRIHNEFWRERNSYAEVQTNAALKNLKRTITTRPWAQLSVSEASEALATLTAALEQMNLASLAES